MNNNVLLWDDPLNLNTPETLNLLNPPKPSKNLS